MDHTQAILTIEKMRADYEKLRVEYARAIESLERIGRIEERLANPYNAINLAQPILAEVFSHVAELADDDGVVSKGFKTVVLDLNETINFNKCARAEEACRFAMQPPTGAVDTDALRDLYKDPRVLRLCDEVDRLRREKEKK